MRGWIGQLDRPMADILVGLDFEFNLKVDAPGEDCSVVRHVPLSVLQALLLPLQPQQLPAGAAMAPGAAHAAPRRMWRCQRHSRRQARTYRSCRAWRWAPRSAWLTSYGRCACWTKRDCTDFAIEDVLSSQQAREVWREARKAVMQVES